MIAEIFIIIGLALMVIVSISKIPNRKLNTNNNMSYRSNNKIINQISEFLSNFSEKIKKNILKFNKVSKSKLNSDASSIRGENIYPDASLNTEKNDNIYDKSIKKNQEHFWNQDHRVEKTALIENSDTFNKAEELFKQKNFKQAESYYVRAAAENPDNHKIFNRLGAIYIEQKNYSDAVEAFNAAVQIDAGIPSRHYNLAIAYLAKGDIVYAKKSLNKAIELEPSNLKYRKTLEDLR